MNDIPMPRLIAPVIPDDETAYDDDIIGIRNECHCPLAAWLKDMAA